jgi:hypothetical protein
MSTTLAYPSPFGLFSYSGTDQHGTNPGEQFNFGASYFESRTPAFAFWQVYASTPDLHGLSGFGPTLQSATLNTDYLNLPGVVNGTTTYAGGSAGTPTPIDGCSNSPPAWSNTSSFGDLSSAITVVFHGAGTFSNDPAADAGQNKASLWQNAQAPASSGARTALSRFMQKPGAQTLPRSLQRMLRAAAGR